MKKIKNILTLSATVIATVIGAGFATGREIFSFFCIHGVWGIVGLICVFVLFWFAFDAVLCFCYDNAINGFSSFLNCIPMRWLARMVEVCVAAFSFCGLCAMAAATGTYFAQTLHLPYAVGVVILLVLCSIVLLKDIRGLTNVNLLLAPFICAGLLWVCVHSILFRDVQTFAYGHYYQRTMVSIRDGIVYVSYNLLSVLVVLCSMRTYCENKKEIKSACFISSATLTMLAICIWGVLCVYRNKIELGSIPLSDIVVRSGSSYSLIYSLLLLFSVFTTAIGCGYGALDFLKTQYRMQTHTAVIVLILATVPICAFGFSEIVRVIYSFFGYLGLPFLIFLIYLASNLGRKHLK